MKHILFALFWNHLADYTPCDMEPYKPIIFPVKVEQIAGIYKDENEIKHELQTGLAL